MTNEGKKECCTCDDSNFERNNYYYGKLMTVRDFEAEQNYFNNKRWLINRMVNGWGVVCGLDVYKNKENEIIVKPGIAIDPCGREIVVCDETPAKWGSKKPDCHTKEEKNSKDKKRSIEKEFYVCLEYMECKTEAVPLPPMECSPQDRCEYNRIRDSFRITLKTEADVNLEDPYGKYCPNTEKCEKSIHDYLCEKLKDGCPDCPECPCIVLAKITITLQGNPECPTKEIEIASCFNRKLVYGNAMLFDLINCFHGDLPKVTKINWCNLHTRSNVSWNEFLELINYGLEVTFSKLMDHDTINCHTFIFKIITTDERSGYGQELYIPAENGKICMIDVEEDCTKITKATFKVEDDWKCEEMESKHSEFNKCVDVQIILKGSAILDLNKKALDGEYVGGTLPSGNGKQGGDLFSYFAVKPKPKDNPVQQKAT